MEAAVGTIRAMYRTMVRVRLFEERVARLVEAGEIRTPCHLYIGQEAIAAGVCAALEVHDYAWGGHRSHGHYLAKGGDLRAMMAELFGKATGCSGGRGGSMHLVAPEVGLLGTVPIVGATIPLAIGAGMAAKLRGDGRVSVAFFGDGATEEGHFHESLNLAALYRLPVVFVCENNFYASHLQLFERRVRDSIVATADVAGAVGTRVDGNDLEAVHSAAVDAVSRARSGAGPTLLECRTYRWRGHVGPSWDVDVGVKRKDELSEWLSKDPLARTRNRLRSRGVPEAECLEIERAASLEIDEAVRFACESPYPDESDMTRFVWTAAAQDRRR